MKNKRGFLPTMALFLSYAIAKTFFHSNDPISNILCAAVIGGVVGAVVAAIQYLFFSKQQKKPLDWLEQYADKPVNNFERAAVEIEDKHKTYNVNGRLKKNLKILFLILFVGLFTSFLIDVHRWLYPSQSLPVVSQGSLTDVADWSTNLYFAPLTVSGVIKVDDATQNLTDGYQFWMFNIEESGGYYKCNFYDTVVLNNLVSMGKRQDCKLTSINLNQHTAQVYWKETTITVNGKNVTWTDARDSGRLISVFDRIYQ